MTPAERRQLENTYDRLYSLYEQGGIRPGELTALQQLDDQLRPNWTAEAERVARETQPTLQAREPSVVEDIGSFVGNLASDYLGFSPRGGQSFGRRVSGLLDVAPFTGSGVAGAQANRDFASGNYGSAAMNAGFAVADLWPLLGVARRARSPVSASSAAADTYRVGGRLAAPSGYSGPAGRPSSVGILGEQFEARPISAIEDAATEYMRRRGLDTSPMTEYPAFSEDRARYIAAAYDQMRHDPSNPDVRRAYDAMIGETMDQYNALRNSGIDFKFISEGMADPYAESPALGYRDLVENGRLFVFPTDQGFGTLGADVADNPLLQRVGRVGDLQDATANDAFRAVHDVFGHFGPGNPFFRRQGEERAFLEHQRMYTPDARGAMTSETRGQNSWLNSGPYGAANRTALGADTVFADQKTGLLSPWTYDPSGMPDPDQMQELERYMREQGWR
jgi:hypothetical protein